MESRAIHSILRDGTRGKIMDYLAASGGSTYTEILNHFTLSTGKLNYHLKVLAPFLEKDGDRYLLNEAGANAEALLNSFPRKEGAARKGLFIRISWLFLGLSIVSLLFSIIGGEYLQFAAVVLLLIGAFFLFQGRQQGMGTAQFALLLILGLALAVESVSLQFTASSSGLSGLTLSMNLPLFIETVVYFGTFVAWAQGGEKGWLLTALLIGLPSCFFIIIFALSATALPGPGVTAIYLIPFPVLFVPISFLSSVLTQESVD